MNSYEDRLRSKFEVVDTHDVWQDIKDLDSVDIAKSGPRYGAWTKSFDKLQGLPKELILPHISVDYTDVLPRSMLIAEERHRLNPDAALALSRQHWGYYYYLGGGLSTVDLTPAAKPPLRAQSILRMAMINGVLDKIFGGEKENTSVLDFACNWGGMAIDMALRGFKDVAAFDFKEQNITRAKLLASYMGVGNVRLDVRNAYSLPVEYNSGFDIVLNLGLLYHVTDPVALVKKTFELTRKVAVFDTLAHREPFSGYIQAFLSDDAFKRPGMGEQQVEFHPTYRGLVDLIHFVGFRNLIEVVPVIGPEYPQREKDIYFQRLRRTIIAFK